MYHHERIDGKGYYGLHGEDIPFEARIIAVADTFSALRTYRVYRPAKSINETIEILNEAKGAQLDRMIVDSFLSLDRRTLENLECNCRICRERRAAQQAAAAGQSANK
jgi:HD-GYP domain-containing protein (c-di-GMP phosphodiesterase class II)